MASIDRYRSREGYRPPPVPQATAALGTAPPAASATQPISFSSSTVTITPSTGASSRPSHSPSATRRRDVPPAVPSPPSYSSRTSPPRPLSRRNAGTAAVSPRHGPAASPHRSRGPSPDLPPFANQWFYTDNELLSTPSVLDGLSPAEERERRAKGVNFIYQAGIAVQPASLPQVTLYVAAVFFHRFYMRMSMLEEKGGIHHYKIAATALFLANKTEENCFKTKNLIIAVAKVAMKNYNQIVDEQSKEYWRWRDCILMYEELMLETLTFDLMIANPYDQLPVQLRRINQIGCKPLREAAWTFLNDAALTTLPLRQDAADIASAAIFFASVATGEKLDDVHGKPWWQSLRANEARITRATRIMVDFYKENPLKKQNTRINGSPVFHLETTRRPQPQPDLALQADGTRDGSGGGGVSLSSAAGGSATRMYDPSHDVTPMQLDSSSSSSSGSQTQSQTQTQQQPSQSQPVAALSQATTAATSAQGDSDVGLKAAANDLDRHPSNRTAAIASNGNGVALLPQPVASPGKKRKNSLSNVAVAADEGATNGATSEDAEAARGKNGHAEADGAAEESEADSQPPPLKRARQASSPPPASPQKADGRDNDKGTAAADGNTT